MSLRGEIAVALTLGGAITLAIVAGRSTRALAPNDDPASTYRAGPAGSKGVFDVLARLGRPVVRRRTSLFALATNRHARPALLVVNAPVEDLGVGELRQVVRYLGEGGELLAVGDGGGITRCAGWAVRTLSRNLVPESVAVASINGVSLPSVSAYLRPAAPEEPAAPGPNPAPRTIREVQDTRCGALAATRADTLVRTRSGRPVILRLEFPGGGRLILAADDGWFRNRAWRETEIPGVVLPIFSTGASGPIQWDEFHQGYMSGPTLLGSIGDWLVTAPSGWAILQLALVTLFWLIVSAFRFGPAQAVIERRRRSPLEHLDALAAGLEGAGGTETAVALTLAGLRRRLSRNGRAPRGDARQWLATLELVLPTARGRAAARQLSALTHQPGGPERVLAAANSVEDVWEELRPRTTRDASS